MRGKKSPLTNSRQAPLRSGDRKISNLKKVEKISQSNSFIRKTGYNVGSNISAVAFGVLDNIMICLKNGKTPAEIIEIMNSKQARNIAALSPSPDPLPLTSEIAQTWYGLVSGRDDTSLPTYKEIQELLIENPRLAMTKVICLHQQYHFNDWDKIKRQAHLSLVKRLDLAQWHYHQQMARKMRRAVKELEQQ